MDNRLGLHYFEDAGHYQIKDLNHWLPELISKGVHWLVLRNPVNAAIPEEFLVELITNNIQPIIQFDSKINAIDHPQDLKVILDAYSKWGVKYVIFFNQPNLISSWADGAWNKADIVEQFLDRFIPLLKMATQAGLTSVFPPLQPGGDYWDTAFLKKVLKSAINRKCLDLITDFHIAVSAQTFSKPLDWGIEEHEGSQSKVYSNSKDLQNHIGFHTVDQYSQIAKHILGYLPKAIMFWYGACDITSPNTISEDLDVLIGLAQNDPGILATPLAENVIACNFYPLSTLDSIPGITAERKMARMHKLANKNNSKTGPSDDLDENLANNLASWVFSIDHYLLLPEYKHGIPEYILEKVRPILKQEQPTIGFSLDEASLARKVTVWNENHAFSEGQIELLRKSGCMIEEKVINGMEIALE